MDRRNRRRGWTLLAPAATTLGIYLLCGAACIGSDERRRLNIAYSAIGDDNTWFSSFSDQMAAEAGRRGHTYFDRRAVFNADDQKHQQSQIDQVKDLMSTRPDVLVLAPVAVNRAMEAVKVANDAGVPVIIVNRDAENPVPLGGSDKYFTTIRSDFEAFGRDICGKQLRRIFGNATIKLLHLRGTAAGSNTIGMEKGCEEAMQADGHMEMACEDYGNYEEQTSYLAAKRQIGLGCDFNAVFGHGDTEGLGAVKALQEAAVSNPKYRPGTDPKKGEIIIAVADASRGSIANIKAGLLYGAMTTSPYYAGQVYDAIEKHFRGEPVPPFIPVIDFFIDVNNIAQYEAFGY
jgi:galactofuranose transport system substrate-binding protein